jgi:hypothetical protein
MYFDRLLDVLAEALRILGVQDRRQEQLFLLAETEDIFDRVYREADFPASR